MRRTPVLALALAALLVAGCLQPLPDHPPGGTHEVAPITVKGRAALDVEEVNVTWRPAPGDEGKHLVWEVEHAEWLNGIFTIRAVGASDEGHDFVFTLRFRVDGPHPVHLAFNESLAREDSFNFTYEEAPFWAGRTVDHVVTVDRERSWVDVLAWERASEDVAGKFHLEFTGACAEECPHESEPVPVVLDGAFPIPRH